MLRREDWMEIKTLAESGEYQKDIAEQLGIGPKTVTGPEAEGLLREDIPTPGTKFGARSSGARCWQLRCWTACSITARR